MCTDATWRQDAVEIRSENDFLGRISLSTFIVGRAPSGELVALLTGQVET